MSGWPAAPITVLAVIHQLAAESKRSDERAKKGKEYKGTRLKNKGMGGEEGM